MAHHFLLKTLYLNKHTEKLKMKPSGFPSVMLVMGSL